MWKYKFKPRNMKISKSGVITFQKDEKYVEKYLVKQVEKLGGKCLKWVCPGMSGVPDRIVLLPVNRAWFVETKRPNGKARPIQLEIHKMLRTLGHDVRVLDTREAVDEFINEIRNA